MQSTHARPGWFYLIQLEPVQLPARLKLGFTFELDNRLRDHQVTCPTLKLVQSWPCWMWCEKPALLAVASYPGLTALSHEVFDCPDLTGLTAFLTARFAQILTSEYRCQITPGCRTCYVLCNPPPERPKKNRGRPPIGERTRGPYWVTATQRWRVDHFPTPPDPPRAHFFTSRPDALAFMRQLHDEIESRANAAATPKP
jgi:hypothetical protein